LAGSGGNSSVSGVGVPVARPGDGLEVQLVRKRRRLPLPGLVLVNKGDHVAPDSPVAKIIKKPGIPWVVPVARLLGIEANQLGRAMLKQIGDKVKMKELMARAEQGLYGRKELEAPTDGTIEEISTRSGRVVIREEFGKEEPPVKIDVAYDLGCKPKEVRKFMLRQIGQEVKRGQIFAKKGEMAAFFTKTSRASISGVISHIDDNTGHVTISRPFKEVIVNAYMRGVVSDIIPERGAVVEVPAVRLTGIFGLGRETSGTLKTLVRGPAEPLTEDLVPSNCEGLILVGGSHATNEALKKALDNGARGVITGTANYLNITKSLGVKLGVGITGQEDIDMTVILMEGFGQLQMREHVWKVLRELEGREASINGATQIRAGAIRPEIIVPFPDWTGPIATEKVVDEELSVGMRVRVVNEPYFGAVGTIVQVPKQPDVVETEARVPVIVLEMEGTRERIVVPRPNVELF